MRPPPFRLDHLQHLSTPLGLYEHALGTTPRVEHGFCVDDVARGLVVTARVPEPSPEVRALTEGYLGFLLAAQHDDGLMHNRRNVDGSWADAATADDHWGRALWAFGTATAQPTDAVLAARAREGAARSLRARSPWPRAMAYAALGAGLLLRARPGDTAARRLLVDARTLLRRVDPHAGWPWPEARLSYANAVLPEAMIVIGDHLGDTDLGGRGLALLGWLVDEQTRDGHLSVVASGGRTAADRGATFAQQPIEVAVLAEACRTAFLVTEDEAWLGVVERCLAWFAGDNDGAVAMCDVATGGGYDGLEASGASRNQGAESTLAWLSTAQVAAMSPAVVTR